MTEAVSTLRFAATADTIAGIIPMNRIALPHRPQPQPPQRPQWYNVAGTSLRAEMGLALRELTVVTGDTIAGMVLMK
jgi:hypothetical protein